MQRWKMRLDRQLVQCPNSKWRKHSQLSYWSSSHDLGRDAWSLTGLEEWRNQGRNGCGSQTRRIRQRRL